MLMATNSSSSARGVLGNVVLRNIKAYRAKANYSLRAQLFLGSENLPLANIWRFDTQKHFPKREIPKNKIGSLWPFCLRFKDCARYQQETCCSKVRTHQSHFKRQKGRVLNVILYIQA